MLYKCIPRDAAFKMPISALPAACNMYSAPIRLLHLHVHATIRTQMGDQYRSFSHIAYQISLDWSVVPMHPARTAKHLAVGIRWCRPRPSPSAHSPATTVAADSRKTEQPIVLQLYLNTSSIRSSCKVDSVTEVRADDTLTAWYHCPSPHTFPVLDAL